MPGLWAVATVIVVDGPPLSTGRPPACQGAGGAASSRGDALPGGRSLAAVTGDLLAPGPCRRSSTTTGLARYLYIWAVYLGAAVALRRGNHIVVAVVAERLPPAAARAVALGGQALALFFLVELAVQGVRLAIRAHTVSAITLPIPWSAIYAAAPVAAGLMILQTIEATWMGLSGPARRP